MAIKQERVNEKIIEMNKGGYDNISYFCVEVRESADNWNFPWEIREDGTRLIMAANAKTIEEAEKIFTEFKNKITREGR